MPRLSADLVLRTVIVLAMVLSAATATAADEPEKREPSDKTEMEQGIQTLYRAYPLPRTYRWSSVETISGFPGAVASRILNFMSTLHDIEALVAQFSPEQLAELERFVRQMRLQKTRSGGPSVLDLAPLDLGRSLQPLGTREQWFLAAMAKERLGRKRLLDTLLAAKRAPQGASLSQPRTNAVAKPQVQSWVSRRRGWVAASMSPSQRRTAEAGSIRCGAHVVWRRLKRTSGVFRSRERAGVMACLGLDRPVVVAVYLG